MDSALYRLVVRGPAAEVELFRKAASSRSKPGCLTVNPEHQLLSFKKLWAALPGKNSAGAPVDIEEPWDLAVDRLKRYGDGTTELTYKFQLAGFDCDQLVRDISKQYPKLCFISGVVAPDVDQQSSLLAYQGRVRRWRLPESRKAAILSDVPEETEDNADEVSFALSESDWAMMDAVVDHWKTVVNELMSRSAAAGSGKTRSAARGK